METLQSNHHRGPLKVV